MKLQPFIMMLLVCATLKLQAQADSPPADAKDKKIHHQMNFVKVNLTSIVLKNYAFQYERIITKPVSLSLSYRFMPTSKIPFANTISNSLGDSDPEAKQTIQNLRMSNYAITPELRFYLGKGYGKGFYIALFYRYASFTFEHVPFHYNDNASIDLSGKLTSNTGGIMFGAQFPLGKHFCIDWWIIGAHYGSGSGNFAGVSSQPLSASEQDELRKNLNDLDIPLTTKTVNVTANGATLKLDGPWGGLRSGILFGFKF